MVCGFKPAGHKELEKDQSRAKGCFPQNWLSTLGSYWSLRKTCPCIKRNIVAPILQIQTSSQTMSELNTLPVLQVFKHQNKGARTWWQGVCPSELDWIILVYSSWEQRRVASPDHHHYHHTHTMKGIIHSSLYLNSVMLLTIKIYC